MTARNDIEVTIDQFEELAFESGQEITIGRHHASLTIGGRTFVARIPQQRQPENRGPLNTGPTVRVPMPKEDGR